MKKAQLAALATRQVARTGWLLEALRIAGPNEVATDITADAEQLTGGRPCPLRMRAFLFCHPGLVGKRATRLCSTSARLY